MQISILKRYFSSIQGMAKGNLKSTDPKEKENRGDEKKFEHFNISYLYPLLP
jgi:hypothetical protein